MDSVRCANCGAVCAVEPPDLRPLEEEIARIHRHYRSFLTSAEREETEAREEVGKVRRLLGEAREELACVDRELRGLRAEVWIRIQEVEKLQRANAVLREQLGGPRQRSRAATGSVRTIRAVHSPLTAEEIFHQISAEAAGIEAGSEEELSRVQSFFEDGLEIPLTAVPGLQKGLIPGGHYPRPGGWSKAALGVAG